MTKRLYYILGLAVFLFLVAFLFGIYTSRANKLKPYAQKIEQHLHEDENIVEDFFENKDFIKRQLSKQNASLPFSQIEQDFLYLQGFSNRLFTISIYQKDSLVFWTNNFALPYVEDVKAASPNRERKMVSLRSGKYEIIRQKFIDPEIGPYTLVGLIPIKYLYELDSKYLEHKFAADANIPTQIILQNTPNDFPIKTRSGQELAYLSANGPLTDVVQLQWTLFLFLLAFITLGVFLNGFARHLLIHRSQLQGAAFLIATLFGIRLLTVIFDFTGHFSVLPIFTKNFDTNLSSSLGDLLINILLLLWIMLFFYREFKIRTYDHLPESGKFWLTSLNYLSILIGILLITSVFKTLVFHTTISFDFDNVFNLDRYSLIAIVGVILLLMALYLFSHRMMNTIVRIGLTWHIRLGALGIALASSIPLLFFFDLLLPATYILLIAFVFIQIFDLFIDSKVITFTWLVIWLVILSAFPAILLFKYNAYRDRTVRLSYAKELSNLRDPIAESSFKKLKENIKQDNFISGEFAMPFPFQIDENKIKRQIDKYFTRDSYLFYNYEYSINAFNKYQQDAIKNQQESYLSISQKIAQSQSISDEELWFWSDNGNKKDYFLELPIQVGSDADKPVLLYLEFTRQRREPSMVYTELLIDRQFKNLQELKKYDYAIYKDGKRIDSEGKIYGPLLTIPDLPAPGKNRELIHENRSDILYHGDNGVMVLIGREKETFLKAISLFSYIFGMLISLVLSFALLNTLFPILPNSVSFSISSKPSLKNRIQLSVISLIVVSFIIIGFVTVWFFRTSSEEYHESRLERKTYSVLTNARHEIELLLNSKDSIMDLQKMVVPISQIHHIDVNLYNLNGRLINSSEGDIFNKGILAPWMPSLAYQALVKQGLSEYIQEKEKVGDLLYKASYVPLSDNNNKTIAYLGLPYYSKQRQLRNDITVFMSTLLNVYVFLLLIAGGIAIMVANSITRPLAKIGEKLKQLRLGGSNEPLEWKSKDELGALIDEYNKMIHQLDESANRLAQSERESAWREMAKQVAHEIKNPLTPMKLSIQYLQHAYRSNPDDIEPLLKRVASTLIEQIDNLAQIASEFSNFAKMPRAENQQIDLNQLIGSVFHLFSKERADMEMTLELPEKQFLVFADKNHLMRVFNNLIKNAIQAIPDDRQGIIKVSLYLNNDLATVKVSDNGTGIANDKRDKVFVPNFTTKSSGTGLGLAISKNIIESVDGRIRFNTELGKGTDFYVELPLVEMKEFEEV